MRERERDGSGLGSLPKNRTSGAKKQRIHNERERILRRVEKDRWRGRATRILFITVIFFGDKRNLFFISCLQFTYPFTN